MGLIQLIVTIASASMSETWKLPDQADNADIDTPT